MNKREVVLWLATGAAVWASATALLALWGGMLFQFYWPAVAAICGAFVIFFLAMSRVRRIAPAHQLRAAACLAIPGVLGEVPVLLTFPQMVPSFAPDAAGQYGAFLFLGYGALFAIALWRETRVDAPASSMTGPKAWS